MIRSCRTAAIAAFGFLSLLSTQVSAQNLVNGQCVTSYDPTVDYFPQKYTTSGSEATDFWIEYHNNYKLIHDNVNGRTYALYQCGTTAPTGLDPNVDVFAVPITSAAALETTAVSFLELLGVADTINVVADPSSISSSCFQKYLATSSNVTSLSLTNATLATSQLASVQVSFGPDIYDTTPTDNSTVTSAAVYEPDVLGRATWLYYYAAFYNLEDLATSVMNGITTNYHNLVSATSGYKDEEKPTVAWAVYNAPDQYNNNTASWSISTAAYKVSLTEDAGGKIFNSTPSVFSSSQEFLQAVKDVDILIDETYVATTLDDVLTNYGISDSQKDTFKFVKNQAIYREDGILTPSGGYDWFTTAVVMADALLEDMVNVVNPTAPSAEYKRHWLRNVAKGENIVYTEANACDWDESQPRPSLATKYEGGQFTLTGSANKLMTGSIAATALVVSCVVLLL